MSVRIHSLEAVPLIYPVAGHFKFFENTAGRPFGRPSVLVKLTADDGTVGWGECVPSPRWSYETVDTVLTTLRLYLGPELLGRDPLDIDGCHSAMNRAIAPSFSTGQPICKAGVDLALFDLSGKLLRQMAAQRWGRDGCSAIRLSWTLNPRGIQETESLVEAAFARGYQDFNIKVGTDPAYDIELVRLVRQLAPSAELWADANGGYPEADALAVAPRLADLGVAFFEQPIASNRLRGLARLKRLGALPIILDEGVVSTTDLEEFHALGMLDGLAVKIARVGGVTEARRQVEFLRQNGLIFVGSGLTDPDVSLSASAALFAAYELQHAAALNGPQFLTATVLDKPLRVEDGLLSAPSGFGLGIEVDEAAVERLRMKID